MSEDESLKSEGSVVTEDDVDSDGIASKIEETSSALPVNQKLALNNQVILLRKTLKQTIKKTRFSLEKNIRKLKKSKKPQNLERKLSEIECFKRISPGDITLSKSLDAISLTATLTNPNSLELERVLARILLEKSLQATVCNLKAKYGPEMVESFFVENEKNIKNNLAKRLSKVDRPSKKNQESDGSSDEHQPKMKEKGKKSKKENQKLTETPKATTFDSFFISTTGDGSYKSTVPNSASASDSDDDNLQSKKRKPEVNDKKKLERAKVKRTSEKPSLNLKPPSQSKKNAPLPQIVPPEPAEADVHPSWKAKSEMRKNHIQDFQGTKIKFDD